MNLQKRLAAQILKCSPKRVVFDSSRLDEIKEAITKADLRALVIGKAVSERQMKPASRARARKIHIQKKKGKRRGHGSRKGTANARLSKKSTWIFLIRKQRALLKQLRAAGRISSATHHMLYAKAKGGFFRSVRHINIYLEEHNLVRKDGN